MGFVSSQELGTLMNLFPVAEATTAMFTPNVS